MAAKTMTRPQKGLGAPNHLWDLRAGFRLGCFSFQTTRRVVLAVCEYGKPTHTFNNINNDGVMR